MLVATRLAAGFRDEVIISPDPRICMQRGSQCSAHIVFRGQSLQFNLATPGVPMDDLCVEVRLLGLEVGPCSPRKGSKSFSSSLICGPSDQRLRYDSNRKLARQNTDGGCTMRLLGPRARAHAPIRSLAGLGRGRREALRVEASRWNRRQFFNGPSRRLMRIFADNLRR